MQESISSRLSSTESRRPEPLSLLKTEFNSSINAAVWKKAISMFVMIPLEEDIQVIVCIYPANDLCWNDWLPINEDSVGQFLDKSMNKPACCVFNLVFHLRASGREVGLFDRTYDILVSGLLRRCSAEETTELRSYPAEKLASSFKSSGSITFVDSFITIISSVLSLLLLCMLEC